MKNDHHSTFSCQPFISRLICKLAKQLMNLVLEQFSVCGLNDQKRLRVNPLMPGGNKKITHT